MLRILFLLATSVGQCYSGLWIPIHKWYISPIIFNPNYSTTRPSTPPSVHGKSYPSWSFKSYLWSFSRRHFLNRVAPIQPRPRRDVEIEDMWNSTLIARYIYGISPSSRTISPGSASFILDVLLCDYACDFCTSLSTLLTCNNVSTFYQIICTRSCVLLYHRRLMLRVCGGLSNIILDQSFHQLWGRNLIPISSQ